MKIRKEELDRYEEVICHTKGFDGDHFLLGKDSKKGERYTNFNYIPEENANRVNF